MKPRHPLIALVVTAVAALLLAGCGSGDGSSSAAPSTNTSSNPGSGGGSDAVQIKDFKFSPASLTVKSGARITVTNGDSTAHTATADDGAFDTGNVDPGSSKTITVGKPGNYTYHCTIHPFMKGTIVAN